MLVLLGPSFDGSSRSFEALAAAAQLVVYDLRSRCKPGYWGVVRAIADASQARALAHQLREAGFPVVAIDRASATETDHRFVRLAHVAFAQDELVLGVGDREMPVSYAAILTIVRGEVGSAARPSVGMRSSASSGGFPAVTRGLDVSPARSSDEYPAADLHFHTVRWTGRVDARHCDLSAVPGSTGHAPRDLELFLEELAKRSGVQVDRGARMSSLASYASERQRRVTPVPGDGLEAAPDPFDNYSCLVADAAFALAHGAE